METIAGLEDLVYDNPDHIRSLIRELVPIYRMWEEEGQAQWADCQYEKKGSAETCESSYLKGPRPQVKAAAFPCLEDKEGKTSLTQSQIVALPRLRLSSVRRADCNLEHVRFQK